MNKNFGLFLLNISVALYLFATGILGLSGNSWSSRFFNGDNEIRTAVNAIFKGDLANILVIVLAVIAIIAAVCVLLKFFGIKIPASELCLIICAIVWIVFIVMIDIIHPMGRNGEFTINWLRGLGAHLMGLSGIILAMGKPGKR